MTIQHKEELNRSFYPQLHIAPLYGHKQTSYKSGYLSPDGEFIPCCSFNHASTLKHFFWKFMPDFLEACKANNITLDKYTDPYELYFMVELGFVKISAIVDTSEATISDDDMKYLWFYQWIYPLTKKQIEFLFPV